MQRAMNAISLAMSSHDVMLTSDPPQDAWKARGVQTKLTEAFNRLRDRLAQPEKERYFCERCGKRLGDGIHTCTPPSDRLAQPEPEPVAWLSKCYNDDNEFLGYTLWDRDVGEGCFPVYTAPKEKNT
jgi:hypothetical protein